MGGTWRDKRSGMKWRERQGKYMDRLYTALTPFSGLVTADKVISWFEIQQQKRRKKCTK